MSYRSVIEHALRVYYAEAAEPNAIARELLAKYDADRPGPEAYPGELAMLRSLARTLRVVVRPDDADMDEVRRLLWQHAADDTAARAECGKASDTTPAAPAGPTGRVGQLLDAIRTARGEWPVHRAIAFYRDTVPALRSMPHRNLRTVARGDLRDLTAWGHLQRHDDPENARRFYTLKTRKDGA